MNTEISRSIHPRVVGRVAIYDKSNTCKPWKGKGKLAKKRARLAKRRLEHSQTLASVPIGDRGGFRAPGSMNQHKPVALKRR